MVYVGCPDRNETSGYRWDSPTCDCPESTRYLEENENKDTKGVCAQFLFWTQHREDSLVEKTLAQPTSLTRLEKGGDKYAFAWEASFDVYEDDDFYRAAFLEAHFPSVLGMEPIHPFEDGFQSEVFEVSKKMSKFENSWASEEIESEIDFEPDFSGDFHRIKENPRRGRGIIMNSNALIIPEERPGPDCTKDSCYGTLV